MWARASKSDTGSLQSNVRPAHSIFTSTLSCGLDKAMWSPVHQLIDYSDEQNLLNEHHIRWALTIS